MCTNIQLYYMKVRIEYFKINGPHSLSNAVHCAACCRRHIPPRLGRSIWQLKTQYTIQNVVKRTYCKTRNYYMPVSHSYPSSGFIDYRPSLASRSESIYPMY